MKAKTRRALLYIFMSLFILTMFTASLTLGRYSAELESDGDYQGDYEYILTDTLVVNSVDEFFDAIENGYSNIQIGDNVDNPLIIAGDINDVRTDLTIDLNGHEIQRNNRDPLLNVDDGITLTIIDSKGGGSLYNPVGSVLRVGDEGTITVAAGIFESGPRSSNARNGENSYDEYYNSTNSSTGAGASIDSNNTLSVQYYGRTDNEQDGYSYQLTGENGKATLPIIIPNVKSTKTETEWCHTVNGNMFFSSAIGGYNSNIMQGDTYLYFTVEGDSVQNTAIAASNTSANYYYQYYVRLNNENSSNAGYTYAGRPVYVNKQLTNRYIDVNGEEQTISDSENSNIYLATVYVYNDVKETVAANNPYAAIEATGGNIYVRGGTYYSYFGKENTYCINANGGYMSVDSSSAISFYAYGNGVCVQCNYSTDNLQTRVGDADLRITNGNFYSELGNTISVTNGVMEIGTATFTKDASATGNNVSQGANKSVIDISSGTLTISNSAQLNILGSGVTGISARSGAKVETNNTTIEFNNNQQNGYTYNFGISSDGGDITCRGTTTLNITGSSSTGILSTGGEITGGEITGGTINIEGEFNCNVKMLSDSGVGSSELSSTVIYTNGGTVNLNTTTDNGVKTDGSVGYDTEIESDGFGFVVYSGDLNIGGKTHIETTRGTAVYLNGGALNVDSNSTLDVVSEIKGDCTWALGSTDGTQNLNRYNGVYIRGGSLNSQGTLNVTHKGVANDDYTGSSITLDDILARNIKSYAIRIEGVSDTRVDINTGTITNSVGGGLYVSGGDVTLTKPTIKATGYEEVRGITNNEANPDDNKYPGNSLAVSSGAGTWRYIVSGKGGHAVRVTGGNLTIKDGIYSASQGNGIYVSGSGTTNIEQGTFTGLDSSSVRWNDKNGNRKIDDGETEQVQITGPGASAALKLVGGKVNIFDGKFGQSTSQNGAAFIMGTSSNRATANIVGGEFNAVGADAVVVFRYATVNFDERNVNSIITDSAGVKVTGGGDIEVNGNGASAISLTNDLIYNNNEHLNRGSIVTIYSGKYTSNVADRNDNDGIWYGCSADRLIVSDGEFTGNRSGLYFGVAPGTTNNVNNVQLSGGTYNGRENYTQYELPDLNNRAANNAIAGGSNINYSNILGANVNAYGYVSLQEGSNGYLNEVPGETNLSGSNINNNIYRGIKYDVDIGLFDVPVYATAYYNEVRIQ